MVLVLDLSMTAEKTTPKAAAPGRPAGQAKASGPKAPPATSAPPAAPAVPSVEAEDSAPTAAAPAKKAFVRPILPKDNWVECSKFCEEVEAYVP